MPTIEFEGERYPLLSGETVLECLQRVGCNPASSCRSGSCQSCMLQATAGEPPKNAQVGLKEAWKQQGMFLACLAKPTADLTLQTLNAAGVDVAATVVEKRVLNHDIVLLKVQTNKELEHRAGQFVNVVRPLDQVSRPYSVASLANEPLELHIRRIEGGMLSPWLCDLNVGDELIVRGPSGSCFYLADQSQPLVLAGTSTGLAPLLGIVRDALASGHTGEITLFHGSLTERGLYLAEELEELNQLPNVSIIRCVLNGPASEAVVVGAIEDLVLAHPELKQSRAWLCGAPSFVKGLKKRMFLGGMSLKAISTDAFVQASG